MGCSRDAPWAGLPSTSWGAPQALPMTLSASGGRVRPSSPAKRLLRTGASQCPCLGERRRLQLCSRAIILALQEESGSALSSVSELGWDRLSSVGGAAASQCVLQCGLEKAVRSCLLA